MNSLRPPFPLASIGILPSLAVICKLVLYRGSSRIVHIGTESPRRACLSESTHFCTRSGFLPLWSIAPRNELSDFDTILSDWSPPAYGSGNAHGRGSNESLKTSHYTAQVTRIGVGTQRCCFPRWTAEASGCYHHGTLLQYSAVLLLSKGLCWIPLPSL